MMGKRCGFTHIRRPQLVRDSMVMVMVSVQISIHRNKVKKSIGVPEIYPLAGTWDPSKPAE